MCDQSQGQGHEYFLHWQQYLSGPITIPWHMVSKIKLNHVVVYENVQCQALWNQVWGHISTCKA